jgi:hypothetical protein
MAGQQAMDIIGSTMSYLRLIVQESGEDNGETCLALDLERVLEWLEGRRGARE